MIELEVVDSERSVLVALSHCNVCLFVFFAIRLSCMQSTSFFSFSLFLFVYVSYAIPDHQSCENKRSLTVAENIVIEQEHLKVRWFS